MGRGGKKKNASQDEGSKEPSQQQQQQQQRPSSQPQQSQRQQTQEQQRQPQKQKQQSQPQSQWPQPPQQKQQSQPQQQKQQSEPQSQWPQAPQQKQQSQPQSQWPQPPQQKQRQPQKQKQQHQPQKQKQQSQPQSQWPQPPQQKQQSEPQSQWPQPPQQKQQSEPQSQWPQAPQQKQQSQPQSQWPQPPQQKQQSQPQSQWPQPPQQKQQSQPQSQWPQPPQQKQQSQPQSQWPQPPQQKQQSQPQSQWPQPPQQKQQSQPQWQWPQPSQQKQQSQPQQQQPIAQQQQATAQQQQQKQQLQEEQILKIKEMKIEEPQSQSEQQPLGTQPVQEQKQSPVKISSSTLPSKNVGSSLMIRKRKNPKIAGTLGHKIEVLTNMMQIKFGPQFQRTAIHYDVDIVPCIPKYLLRSVFRAAKEKLFPKRNPAFDGKKNAFSAGYLPVSNPVTTSVVVYNEDGKEKNFQVTMKVVNEIDLSWLKQVSTGIEINESHQISIQALDIILRDAPAHNATIVGRSFFSPPKGQVLSLGGGMDLWVGLFQSAVLGWKPYLNVDVVHKAFPKSENVIEAMKTICLANEPRNQQGREKNLNDPDTLYNLVHVNKDAIRTFLKNLKVTVEIPGQATSRRTQRVVDLVKPARDNRFEYNNSTITVEQYYRLEKKYTLRYPLLPCLWVGPKDKNIHVPPEICTIISGQAVHKTLSDTQTAAMVRYASTGTNIRKQKIMDAFKAMDHARNSSMKEFDISISGEFEKVPARVLEAPMLKYKDKIARVNKGVWRADKFLTPSRLIADNNSWTILNLNKYTNERDLYELNNKLVQIGQSVDMVIGKPVTPFRNIVLRGPDTRELFAYFKEQKERGLKLIIVIVPETKGHYSKVKQITELNVGVLTQCIKSRTVGRLSDATVGNILLKINAKLNGVNHMIETQVSRPKCLQTPCMIVGADVTHPSPDACDIPSIAAVAASHDPNAFQYNIEIRMQPPRQEVISNLLEIMIIQLKYFRAKTNYQPQKIIFYRDGVSEGQFQQIMDVELQAIRAACQKLNVNYKPDITFLVVQKRHHIRLFPTNPKFSDDKNFNVQAGTIVDTNITHPTHIDFYLVSHASIQGTARPTKYRCLWDDSDMSENEIENLTYFLCHMFSRCTRAVSYPTPTYYAHLAAFRARALTQDVPIKLDNLQQEQQKKLTINSQILKDMPMFFV